MSDNSGGRMPRWVGWVVMAIGVGIAVFALMAPRA